MSKSEKKDLEKVKNNLLRLKRQINKSSINVALHNGIIGKLNAVYDLIIEFEN